MFNRTTATMQQLKLVYRLEAGFCELGACNDSLMLLPLLLSVFWILGQNSGIHIHNSVIFHPPVSKGCGPALQHHHWSLIA